MKLVNDLLGMLEKNVVEGVSCQAESDAFAELLKEHGADGIKVDITKDGSDYIVCLEDQDGDKEVLVFGVDEEENAYCIPLSGEIDAFDNEADVIDLQTCEPTLSEDGDLDMTNLKWMNKSVVMALFSEALSEEEAEADPEVSVDEKVRIAIRGGKKVKIPIKLRKKILSGPQKAALIKARRKSGTGAALRKRAKSLLIRKRMGIKGKKK